MTDQDHPNGVVAILEPRVPSATMKSDFPYIEEWKVSQKARRLSPRTVEARIDRLEDFARHLGRQPADATSREITEYMAMIAERRNWRGEPLSQATMSTYHSHIAAWFDWLIQMEYRDDNPCARLKPPTRKKSVPRPVTDSELRAVLFDTSMHRRTKMMILLGALQGMRCHEIAKIRGEDVNLIDNLIRIKGKGGSDVTNPLHEVIAVEARSYPTKGFWFPMRGHDGEPIHPRSVSSIVGRVFDRAHVDGGAHRLRHWYASTLLHDGANTRLVQDLMRHLSIQSTEIYTQVEQSDRIAAMRRLTLPIAPIADAAIPA